MNFVELLNIDRIALNVRVNNKEEAINFLLNLAKKSGQIENIDEIKKEIQKRESLMSTGIGKGLAIPHAKSKYIKGVIVTACTFKNNINFDSIDDLPVKLCFLVLCNDTKIGEHLKILSKISRVAHNETLRDKLIKSNDKNEFLKLFNDFS